uniref:BOS complex subunit TMEM147 n=1 Tax=Cairina moschata TaxID=8855 RepID=A0A8C3GG86_CAIMO
MHQRGKVRVLGGELGILGGLLGGLVGGDCYWGALGFTGIYWSCSSEYSAFWRCVQAGATYLLVQLGKMLFLATFFPTWEGPSGGYDLVGEFLKATVDVADLGGLQLALGRGAGKGEHRILVAAMGWATAELLTSRCATWPRRRCSGPRGATTSPPACACPWGGSWWPPPTRASSPGGWGYKGEGPQGGGATRGEDLGERQGAGLKGWAGLKGVGPGEKQGAGLKGWAGLKGVGPGEKQGAGLHLWGGASRGHSGASSGWAGLLGGGRGLCGGGWSLGSGRGLPPEGRGPGAGLGEGGGA